MGTFLRVSVSVLLEWGQMHIVNISFLECILVTKITLEERKAIERRTIGQSKNPRWYDERTKRLSSSMFGRIVKALNSDKTDKTKLASSLVNVVKITAPALKHGLKYETMAISRYMTESGEEVKMCGIVVARDFPFLSCSPDGIINNKRIVEVKCPYSAKDKPINSVTVPYLKSDKESGFYLDKIHDYFFQIQGQLLCTEAEECVFIVYTITDMVYFKVPRDEDFIMKMIQGLKTFFDLYFKEALLEKRFYKTYVE
ncbi:uncharacterized protein LOC132724501 [Ruditapes philippinarum]|uniref:uncharacterized protein LOC132724501 n=1 Tax=Ruditapes philippinarum TaxID=129788 RepID=UPI00295AF4BD|nr:uncharacterized protein LOC132724501 [Ruditapes philippinarum]